MILCVCGHFRSDHKGYDVSTQNRLHSRCSLPECDCEEFNQDGVKKKDRPFHETHPLYRKMPSHGDIEKTLNRKFRKK